MKNYAHLHPNSPWVAIFPDGMVPIVNCLLPSRANLEGEGEQDVYMVDLKKLILDQFDRLCRMVLAQCDPGGDLEQCKFEIERHGLPLRAKYVLSVSTDQMFFL